MAARSVAELLPRPFEEESVEDVQTMLSAVGEERESLFFERKSQVTGDSLAKACAAFANTYGGLLIVGVSDDEDKLVGTKLSAKEAQLWVKDTLHGRVLPLPPFRARWLWLDEASNRGLLLVLVEESATTPHLLTRQGAIYVRNPGSSDPVPLGDQRRLLDLFQRGRDAQQRAINRVNDLVLADHPGVNRQFMALVPTGVSETFEEKLFSQGKELLVNVLGRSDAPRDRTVVTWEANSVTSERHVAQAFSFAPPRVDQLRVWRDGAVLRSSADAEEPDDLGGDEIAFDALYQPFATWLGEMRDLLLTLGAHGDVRLSYGFGLGRMTRRLLIANQYKDFGGIAVPTWTGLDSGPHDDGMQRRVFDEIARGVGIGPKSVYPSMP